MDDDNTQYRVELYIYDLSQGLASVMSQMLIGRHLDGIWHTSVVVYGREFFFGSSGIQCCAPGTTVLKAPLKKELIGDTFIPFEILKDYLRGLAEGNFRGTEYNLLKNNCNSFSEDLCQFLCGTSIPKYILDLPSEFLATPLGQSLGPLIDGLASDSSSFDTSFALDPQLGGARETSPDFVDLNNQIEEARLKSLALDEKRQVIQDKIAKKKKKEDRRKKSHSDNDQQLIDTTNGHQSSESAISVTMSEVEISETATLKPRADQQALDDDENDRKAEEERRKNRETPVIFSDIDAKSELEALVKLVDGQLSKEEENAIEELHQYLIEGEGSWALGDNFLTFVGRILQDPNISTETRVHLLRALSYAALKDDVVLLLHQDRRDHVLMNYAHDIDRRAPEEQQSLAIFMCNLFENTSSSEWLLYISEWSLNNQQTSNIRATTKVAVHCLLATCPTLQDVGTAIIHNLACKEVKTVVFDDVAIELTMALMHFFSTKPTEEHLFRAMKALSKFVTVSPDIPQLVQMVGPHPNTFNGTSARIDVLIEQISKKVR